MWQAQKMNKINEYQLNQEIFNLTEFVDCFGILFLFVHDNR